MLIVNKQLYDNTNFNIYKFINFINDSTNISLNPQYAQIPILNIKEYVLFSYIKSDFLSNFVSLYNYDINLDFWGFQFIHVNTRHAIEAFFDLYNLCKDPAYINVMMYCNKIVKECVDLGKYEKYKNDKGFFTIKSKCDIAEEKGEKFQRLVHIAAEANSFTHPDVFIDPPDIDKKIDTLIKLLNVNLYLLDRSYKLIIEKFFNGNVNTYFCNSNSCIKKCLNCYNLLFNSIADIIKDKNILLVPIPQPQYMYYQNNA